MLLVPDFGIEQALNDKEQGRVNEYVSADELFSKLGI